MKITKLFLLLIPFVLLGCSNQDPDHKVTELKELQKLWTLASIDGHPVSKGTTSTLHIDSKNKATGTLGCNLFFGTFKLEENKAIIEKMGATRRLCDEPSNKLESIVSMTLTTLSDIKVSETQLIISDGNHSLKYTFKL